ncbi:hypothetical protein EDD37DRAFT_317908 [Exophiala viscosa]|uniref:Uncharacterized protein n=1 Tax=Exophiala viscosa TaxID=2486360 RepID=A0AAN6ID68_9EURO|nr:hypothetical protein EDD36DRAFT_418876 [Exophiala viscosa]KAI1625788.1 hypothetical protein EDD37DRAFT_317908 [Exophiala viscosa]
MDLLDIGKGGREEHDFSPYFVQYVFGGSWDLELALRLPLYPHEVDLDDQTLHLTSILGDVDILERIGNEKFERQRHAYLASALELEPVEISATKAAFKALIMLIETSAAAEFFSLRCTGMIFGLRTDPDGTTVLKGVIKVEKLRERPLVWTEHYSGQLKGVQLHRVMGSAQNPPKHRTVLRFDQSDSGISAALVLFGLPQHLPTRVECMKRLGVHIVVPRERTPAQ